MQKYVYFFGGGKAEGKGDMKDTLGGKGAGLAEMTNAGLPVPPGFTISTEVCRIFYENKGKLGSDIQKQVDEALARLESVTEQKLGSTERPLLVSVRSGAKFSMPGMMDTILNLGLNDTTVKAMAARTGNERFAWDSYRRFIQMFGSVVLQIDKREFEEIFDRIKEQAGAKLDTDIPVNWHQDSNSHPRTRSCDARVLQAAPRDHRQARTPLSRYAGLRVHNSRRPFVHAADAERQAHRQGGRENRNRHGWRGTHLGRRCDHA